MIDTSAPLSEQTSVGSGYQIWVDRGTDAACNAPQPPPGTYAVIQCSSCIANPSQSSFDCAAGCAEHWPACCPGDGSQPAPNCFGG
jgi:hypothetical protein